MLETFVVILCLSNFITGVFLFRASRKKPVEKTLTVEANELLGELMQGGAVIVTSVLNKEDLFMWSPKTRN